MAERFGKHTYTLKVNKPIIEDIKSEMHDRITDDSFHSSDDLRDDLKSALIRIGSFDGAGDAHPRKATPGDRTKLFQAEHDRIHSRYRFMNPDSTEADIALDIPVGGFIFNCHRRILSSHSPFFAQQVEDFGHRGLTRVRLLEIDTATFMIFFRYIYTKQFYPISLENVVRVTQAAMYLSMKEISIRCTKFILEVEAVADLVREWVFVTASSEGKTIQHSGVL